MPGYPGSGALGEAQEVMDVARAQAEQIAEAEQVLIDAQVRFFRGLGNGQRLRILRALREGERNVGQLVEETGIPQSQVSAGVNCLKWCGFVTARPEGRFVYYRLADPRALQILELAEGMVRSHATELYTCATLTREEIGDEVPLLLTGEGEP